MVVRNQAAGLSKENVDGRDDKDGDNGSSGGMTRIINVAP
jgi:hypothetical protein